MGRKRKIKVVFDTNAIHTGNEGYLLNMAVSEFIKSNLTHSDVEISWILPEIVVDERKFQMTKKANTYLPTIEKLETILGGSVGVDKNLIEEGIKNRIQEQLSSHSILKVKLNTSKVDWKRIMDNSVNRIVPFEDNEKEKGFRDSIILETFDQIVQGSPKTPSICMVILFTDDSRLIEATEIRSSERKNVRTVRELSELKGLINTLISDVEESLINSLSEKASILFFSQKDKSSIYYKKDVWKQINKKFSSELSKGPDSSTSFVEQGSWYITSPSFVKKVKQRVYWNSVISVDLAAYKYSERNTPFIPIGAIHNKNVDLSSYLNDISIVSTPLRNMKYDNPSDYPAIWPTVGAALNKEYIKPTNFINPVSYSSEMIPNIGKEIHTKGKARFTVSWSVTYGINQKLMNPRINNIEFLGIDWEN